MNDSKAILDSVSESIEEAAKAAAEIEKSIVIDPKVLDSINQYLDNTAFFKSVTSEIDWTIFDRMTEVKDWLIRNNFKNNAPIGIIAGVTKGQNSIKP